MLTAAVDAGHIAHRPLGLARHHPGPVPDAGEHVQRVALRGVHVLDGHPRLNVIPCQAENGVPHLHVIGDAADGRHRCHSALRGHPGASAQGVVDLPCTERTTRLSRFVFIAFLLPRPPAHRACRPQNDFEKFPGTPAGRGTAPWRICTGGRSGSPAGGRWG